MLHDQTLYGWMILKIVKILTELEWNNKQDFENELNEVFIEINNAYNKHFRYIITELKKTKEEPEKLNLLSNVNIHTQFTSNTPKSKENSNHNISGKNIFKLFVCFLELVNNQFKVDMSVEELQFLCTIITTDDITKLLQIKSLDLKFRIELLKFFKLLYVEINIDMNKVQLYRTIIINNVDTNFTDNKFQEGEMLKFLKDLMYSTPS